MKHRQNLQLIRDALQKLKQTLIAQAEDLGRRTQEVMTAEQRWDEFVNSTLPKDEA